MNGKRSKQAPNSLLKAHNAYLIADDLILMNYCPVSHKLKVCKFVGLDVCY